MTRIPENISRFMQEHDVAQDEIWLVPGGKSYAIKHSALERIAIQKRIEFLPPQIIEADGANGVAAMIVTGTLADVSAWSVGEASPKNNKNAYCWAMAEKRAKDRVILKLLNMHGAIYSEEEADELRQPSGPAQDYMQNALKFIWECESVQKLKDWWQGEVLAREAVGITNGTYDYARLFTAFKDRGLTLTNNKEAA